jgi:hypothetical protein
MKYESGVRNLLKEHPPVKKKSCRSLRVSCPRSFKELTTLKEVIAIPPKAEEEIPVSQTICFLGEYRDCFVIPPKRDS